MADQNNYGNTLLYAGLAAAGIFVCYEVLQKSSGVNTPLIPLSPVAPLSPLSPPVKPKKPKTPGTPPPSGPPAPFSRSLIFNNICAYLFGASNGFGLLAQKAGFPSVANINSQGFDQALLTSDFQPGLCFGPFPNAYYYMPRVHVSVMIGFPLESTPASYPPMGTFVNGVPMISPPDGALVGLIAAPSNWGLQYYQVAPTVSGAVPSTGFSATLGLWARCSVSAWGMTSINPATNPTNFCPWILHSDSGTQVSWIP